MIEWGINALNHDASLAVFKDSELVFHRRSSEFSGIIGDPNLNQDLIDNAIRFGFPEKIYWYERPWIKKIRQFYAGQYNWVLNFNELPSRYMNNFLDDISITYSEHHLSHAAAGYYTSPFDHCAVVVLDAIGEWHTMSIWEGRNNNLKLLWYKDYPYSLGLFYSAFTDLIGLMPTKEEHLLQSMSQKGDPERFYESVRSYLNKNLHKGIIDWNHTLEEDSLHDIAASVQKVFEEEVDKIMNKAQNLTRSNSLVYMGGCAMNSLYNKRLSQNWDRIWSLPYPGDASSSIGAWAAKKRQKINYSNKVVKHLEIKI